MPHREFKFSQLNIFVTDCCHIDVSYTVRLHPIYAPGCCLTWDKLHRTHYSFAGSLMLRTQLLSVLTQAGVKGRRMKWTSWSMCRRSYLSRLTDEVKIGMHVDTLLYAIFQLVWRCEWIGNPHSHEIHGLGIFTPWAETDYSEIITMNTIAFLLEAGYLAIKSQSQIWSCLLLQ